MSSIEQQLEEAMDKQNPQPIKKRKPRKKPESEKQSKKPNKTQAGKQRTTTTEQSLKLFKERSDRVVKRLPKTNAEGLLLQASMKTLRKIAMELNIEGLSNLRKNDIVILILDKWRKPTV